MSHMTIDDRLDALALIRAHINGDADGIRTIIDHGSQHAYLAVLHFAAVMVETHSDGDPHAYLDDIVADLNTGGGSHE